MSNLMCDCQSERHDPKLIVITGGPGAGKTALVEVARRRFCAHLVALPEAASMLFAGGFPRHPTDVGRRASQRAIFHVQRELESIVIGERAAAVALCDRGSLDGIAYWPASAATFFAELSTTTDAELARYDAVIHLRTPSLRDGYDHSNLVRIESAAEAAAIDERILAAWEGHPRRYIVESSADFMQKVSRALAIIEGRIPECCARSPRSLVGATEE